MEILNSGSFINLENQEKIECLQYTATELANAALDTKGFVNEDEPARKLALEFWQGLEYMCRESEEAQVQNIFTNQFLERLREFRSSAKTIEIASAIDEQTFLSETAQNIPNSEDEFLGIIQTTKTQASSMPENKNEIQEISTERAENEVPESDFPDTVKSEGQESVLTASESEISDSIAEETTITETPNADSETEENAVAHNLTLTEKEPYQFNKCTVTATIQLLPAEENSDMRRAVLSVKTHNFAPNISLVQLSGGNLIASLTPELEKVLAQYQADLPVKVMDKMKKEKSAPKKQLPKVTTEMKTVSSITPKPKEVNSTQNTPSETVQTSSPVIPQTAETGRQGSLFG